MRRQGLLLGALLAVALIAAYTVAQEGDKPKPAPVQKEAGKDAARPEGVRKEGDKPGGLRGEAAKMAEVCGLTEDQQKKVAELSDARDKEIRAIMVKYQAEIMDVLTDEQKAKWNESLLIGGFQKAFQRANLTDEQLAKVKAAIAEQTKGVSLADEKARGDVMRKLYDYVTKEVLTDEQRAAMRPGDRKEGPGQPKAAPKDGERKEGDKKPAGDKEAAPKPPPPAPELPPVN